MEKILELLTSAAAIQGFFLAVVLIRNQKGNKRANIFLAMLLVIFSVVIFHSSYAATYFEHHFNYQIKMNEPFILLIGPFIYFYVRELATDKSQFSIKDIVHFIPFIGYFTIWVPAALISTNTPINDFLKENTIIIGIAAWIITLGLFIYYIRKIVKLAGIHEKRIEDEFSNVEELGIEWVKKIVVIFLIIMVAVISGFFIRVVHNKEGHFGKVISLVSAGVIYFMGYRGLRQPDIFTVKTIKRSKKNGESEIIETLVEVKRESPIEIKEELIFETEKEEIITEAQKDIITEIKEEVKEEIIKESIKEEKEKYKSSSLSENELETIAKKITDYMEREKPYLDPEFNMDMLSEEIATSKNYVSQVINSRFGYNFFNYVNYYRVEEVKKQIRDPKNEVYTILAIAFDAGFNSKASFNSIFKKFTGMTPSEFKKL